MKSKTASNTKSTKTEGLKKPLVSAKSKAVSLLARREHSKIELRAKLLQRGYQVDEIEQAIDWVDLHQFQSDERFKLSLFRRRAPVMGDRAIAAELGQHGLSGVKSIDSDDGAGESLASEEDRAFDWIRRRQASALQSIFGHGDAPDQAVLFALKSKIFKGLSARGFEFGNIDRAWRRVLAEFKSNA